MRRGFWGELRWRVGEWLAWVPGVSRYESQTPSGGRLYRNRINGHMWVDVP